MNVALSKLRADPVTVLSVDPTTDAFRAQIAVNRAVRRVWNHAKWTFRRKTLTFNTVSGQSDYVLDKSVGQVYEVLSANQPYRMAMVSRFNLDKFDPQRTLTGDPQLAAISDSVPVIVQPAAASILQFVSDNVSDTTQSVFVRGVMNGEINIQQINLNGTTPVFTVTQFSSIISITKSAQTMGKVTCSVGATTIVVIGGPEKTVYLRLLSLYPIPQATILMTVRHFGQSFNMVHAYDETGIPDDWDYVVDQWAFLFSLQSKGQDQTTEFATQMTLGMKMLEDDMHNEESDSSDDPILIDDAGSSAYNREALWLAPGRGIVES